MRTSCLPATAVDALPEAERNALLRRADWRFLLPDPQPRRALCLARGGLARAVSHISDISDTAEEIAGHAEEAPGWDLAVLSAPSETELRQAWEGLRPGGTLYVERPAARARRMLRQLAADADRALAFYWPWPWLSRARLWLPLEVPEARAHLLESLHLLTGTVPPPGAARRAASALLRQAGTLHLRRGPRFPVCAVTIKSGGPLPEDGWPLLLCGGPRSTSKVVALYFSPGDSRPRLAVKMSRTPESAATLATEARVLADLDGRSGLPPGIPRPVFVRSVPGSLRVGETPVVGSPFHRRIDRRSYRELALRGTAWLADLAGRSAAEPPERWWGRLVEPVLADFARNFGVSDVVDGEGLRRTRQALERIGPLPLVCEHRDFGPWNLVLPADGGLGVLDWEGAEPRGLPGLDLLYFHAYCSFFLDDALRTGRFRASYRRLLDPGTLQGGVLGEALALYAERTGVSAEALDALRLLVWPLHARSEHRRLMADAEGRPDPALLRRSLFVELWTEELQR
jgi:hypothetical protein